MNSVYGQYKDVDTAVGEPCGATQSVHACELGEKLEFVKAIFPTKQMAKGALKIEEQLSLSPITNSIQCTC